MPKQAVIILLYVLTYLLPLNAFANEYDFEIPDTIPKISHIISAETSKPFIGYIA
jgi:hypothetical protein